MTLEEAKQDYINRAIAHVENHGSICTIPEDDGTYDIGNGDFVDADENERLIMEAI